eukprot:m.125609 g.125609  ORF g.125609 m.125609 type:complete len:213 (-) comp16655_c1_seq2:297-935(-)
MSTWRAHTAVSNVSDDESDDDWETDPDFVNDVSEKDQRWGSKTIEGSGRREVVDLKNMRQGVQEDDAKVKTESKRENFAHGYGGKFGVQSDRVDKVASGFDEVTAPALHSSQVDNKKGFGGKYGIDDRQDKSAVGYGESSTPVGTNYAKPQVTAGSAKSILNKFQTMAQDKEEVCVCVRVRLGCVYVWRNLPSTHGLQMPWICLSPCWGVVC